MKMQDDGLDVESEDSCIMQTPGENFDGKRDRWTKQVRSPWFSSYSTN